MKRRSSCGILLTIVLSYLMSGGKSVYGDTVPLSALMVGRHVVADDHILFDWPCVTIRAEFVGAGSVSMRLNGKGNRFRVTINQQSVEIETGFAEETILLAENLESGRHKVSVKKLTEAASFFIPFFMNQGIPEFYGFETSRSLELQVAPPLAKKIDFYGDSAMAGFGILGDSKTGAVSCIKNMLRLEDCTYAWPSILGQKLRADIHIQAWSGRGISKNAAGLLPWSYEPFPVYWQRSLANKPEVTWDHSQWAPDLIVIGLGHNDFYNRPFPDETYFISEFRQFIEQIKNSGPTLARTPMLVICGGTEWKNRLVCPLIRKAISSLNYDSLVLRELSPDWFTNEDIGCLNHFNTHGNQKLADKLFYDVKNLLNQ